MPVLAKKKAAQSAAPGMSSPPRGADVGAPSPMAELLSTAMVPVWAARLAAEWRQTPCGAGAPQTLRLAASCRVCVEWSEIETHVAYRANAAKSPLVFPEVKSTRLSEGS